MTHDTKIPLSQVAPGHQVLPVQVVYMCARVIRLVVTHEEEGGLLVRVSGTAPLALLTQPLRILHGQQPISLETDNTR